MNQNTFDFNSQQNFNPINLLNEIIRELNKITCICNDNLVINKINDILMKINSLYCEIKKNDGLIGKNNNNKTLVFSNGTYIGQVVNGLREGKGSFFYNNCARYEGDYKKGKKEGKGIMYYNDGTRYEGDFKNGNKEGKGIMYYNNGDRMMGDWSNDKEIGKHVMLTVKGEVKTEIFNNTDVNMSQGLGANNSFMNLGMPMGLGNGNLNQNNFGMGGMMPMNLGLSNLNQDEEWLRGFKLGVEEVNESNKMDKENEEWMKGFQMGCVNDK